MSTYDLYKNKSYNLRLPAELKAKFEIIAKLQGYKKNLLLDKHALFICDKL